MKKPSNGIIVEASASKPASATSGKIIVKKNGHKHVINAVVFSHKQSKTLLEKIDRIYNKPE
jgi:hypothetical protein